MKDEDRYRQIAEEERRLLRLNEAAGTPKRFMSYTDLGLGLEAWWKYREWLQEMMYPEE